MKKHYNMFSLYVVSEQGSYHKFICKKRYNLKEKIYYEEIFTNIAIKGQNLNVEPLMNYYQPEKHMYILTRKQLYDKYIEINGYNYYLSITDASAKLYFNKHGLIVK